MITKLLYSIQFITMFFGTQQTIFAVGVDETTRLTFELPRGPQATSFGRYGCWGWCRGRFWRWCRSRSGGWCRRRPWRRFRSVHRCSCRGWSTHVFHRVPTQGVVAEIRNKSREETHRVLLHRIQKVTVCLQINWTGPIEKDAALRARMIFLNSLIDSKVVILYSNKRFVSNKYFDSSC